MSVASVPPHVTGLPYLPSRVPVIYCATDNNANGQEEPEPELAPETEYWTQYDTGLKPIQDMWSLPPRCVTCASVLGDLGIPYKYLLLERGFTSSKALKTLHVTNTCCRARVLAHLETPRIQSSTLPALEMAAKLHIAASRSVAASAATTKTVEKESKKKLHAVKQSNNGGRIGLEEEDVGENVPLPVPFSIHEAGAEEDVGRESAAAVLRGDITDGAENADHDIEGGEENENEHDEKDGGEEGEEEDDEEEDGAEAEADGGDDADLYLDDGLGGSGGYDDMMGDFGN